MNPRLKKILLFLLAAVFLVAGLFAQRSLNADRARLGLTHIEPLENAPPVLAFTTVALGGFRGLISNALWMRATQLQDEDKFFEMQQLADWITKLEPHFSQVWVHQAWNMAYNISVKFKENAPGEFPDRWRWVKAGIELLRDEGLKYNPNDILIHRELAWFFQHKMGANLDDANMYYKRMWAGEMMELFGGDEPNFEELINPQTPEQEKRSQLLREKYKMKPDFMKQVDETYGPLEWRLPEAHSIYWGAMCLKKAEENPDRVSKDDLTNIRRVIYQSMQLSFYRGKLVRNPFARVFEFGPNLAIFPKVYDAYDEMIRDEPDPNQKDGFRRAQRNVIKDAVHFYYLHNRMADAAKWFQVLRDKFPDAPMIDGQPDVNPGDISLDEYALSRTQVDLNETDRNRMKAIIQGLIQSSYELTVLNEHDQAAAYQQIARKAWNNYQMKIDSRQEAIGLPPLNEIAREVRDVMLDPTSGLPPEARAILRTELGMSPETASNKPATNAAPASAIPPRAN